MTSPTEVNGECPLTDALTSIRDRANDADISNEAARLVPLVEKLERENQRLQQALDDMGWEATER